MKKIKTLIVLYPSFERGGATKNLINFINTCDEKKIQIFLISNIDKNLKKQFLKKDIKVINFFGKFKNRNFINFTLHLVKNHTQIIYNFLPKLF